MLSASWAQPGCSPFDVEQDGASHLSRCMNYIVLIDAGSTHTRVHAYHYKSRRVRSTILPDAIHSIHSPLTIPELLDDSIYVRPGISSYLNDTSLLRDYLKPLVQRAAKNMKRMDPDLDLKGVPLYLAATAGMRLVSTSDQERVMGVISDFFRSDANPFAFEREEQARIISGEEEGAFGWLAVNAVNGAVAASDKTLGALDFGGASAQITFLPKTSILEHMFPMHFAEDVGGPIHLYTHSALGYGTVKAFQNTSLELLRITQKKSGRRTRLEHPCLPKGVRWHVKEGEFGFSTAGTAEREHGDILLEGHGDYEKCAELAEGLIKQEACLQEPCSFAGIYQPALGNTSFVVLGEHGEIKRWGAMEEYKKDKRLIVAVKKQMKRVCSLPESDKVFQHDKMQLECWRGVWMVTMLTKALLFPEDTQQLVLVEHCCAYIQGQALYEVNFYPIELKLSQPTAGSTRIKLAGALPLLSWDHGREVGVSPLIVGLLSCILIAVGFLSGAFAVHWALVSRTSSSFQEPLLVV